MKIVLCFLYKSETRTHIVTCLISVRASRRLYNFAINLWIIDIIRETCVVGMVLYS